MFRALKAYSKCRNAVIQSCKKTPVRQLTPPSARKPAAKVRQAWDRQWFRSNSTEIAKATLSNLSKHRLRRSKELKRLKNISIAGKTVQIWT